MLAVSGSLLELQFQFVAVFASAHQGGQARARLYDPVAQLSLYDKSFSYQVHLSGVGRGSFSSKLKLGDSFVFLGTLQGLALSKNEKILKHDINCSFDVLVKCNKYVINM